MSAYVTQHIPKGHSVMVVCPSIKILVAIENLEKDEHVFTHAKSLAQHLHASLILLHVLSAEDEKTLEQSVDPILLEKLALLAHQTTEAGVPTEFDWRPGGTGEGICEYACDWDARVIVIGSRQSPSLSEKLLGRVSEYVVNHASCSVMIVHPLTVESSSSEN